MGLLFLYLDDRLLMKDPFEQNRLFPLGPCYDAIKVSSNLINSINLNWFRLFLKNRTRQERFFGYLLIVLAENI